MLSDLENKLFWRLYNLHWKYRMSCKIFSRLKFCVEFLVYSILNRLVLETRQDWHTIQVIASFLFIYKTSVTGYPCLSVGKGLSLTSVLFIMNAVCAGVNCAALLGLQWEMDFWQNSAMLQVDDCTTIRFLCGVGVIQFGDLMPEFTQVSSRLVYRDNRYSRL